MAEFDSAIALAKRLITKKGEAVTLRRFLEPTANPTKPWKPTEAAPASEDQTGVRMVFLDFDSIGREPLQFEDGTQVKAGDKRLFVAALGLTFLPELDHTVVRGDGSKWTVKTRKSLNPNGRNIMFELWVTQ